MEKTKNSLSIYLIKEEIIDFEDVMKDDLECQHFDIQDIGRIYYGVSYTYNPSWIDSFFDNNQKLLESLKNSNSKVLLLTKVQCNNDNIRIFALPFGYGYTFIKNEVVEEGFGLKTVLNIIDPDSIRAIEKTSITKHYKSSREQMPKKSEISEFGIDVYTDLMKGITAKSNKVDIIEGIVNGSDKLSCSVPVNIYNINAFLKEIYQEYLKSDYKTNFGWIDQIKQVRDKKLINELNSKLLESIKKKEKNFWMAVPEVITWENVKGIKIQGDNNIYDDILINNVINSFRNELTSIGQLENKKIAVISSLNDLEIISWSSYKCLFGEIEYNNKSYCINSGIWFEVDSDYVSQVNQEYSNVEISDIEFMVNEGLKESEYNKRFAESQSDKYLCLDGKNVSYGGGHSKVEICDIISKDNTLMYIKKYSGSSVLSHLFNQAVVSAELIKSDTKFIAKANEKIDADEFKLEQNKDYNIVFGIISKDESELPNIPFFSKITFNNSIKRLKTIGFKPSIKRIKTLV